MDGASPSVSVSVMAERLPLVSKAPVYATVAAPTPATPNIAAISVTGRP